VLIDYYRWRLIQGKPFDTMSAHPITQEELVACARDQGLEFKQGDILFVRSGWRVGYEQLSPEARLQWGSSPQAWIGVETNLKTLEWLWETGFSACAGDAPGWECLEGGKAPSPEPAMRGYISHEIMIAGWGMPLGKTALLCAGGRFWLTATGEYFDLEALSEECHRQKRYTFFVSSMPLHVTGGVASPANTVAIF
jgi:hypothetical protein